MKLEVNQIGKVSEARIELGSVSVIAGYNGSGKTTISKCLYGMLELAKVDNIDKDIFEKQFSSLFSNQIATIGQDFKRSSLALFDKDWKSSLAISQDDFFFERNGDKKNMPSVVYLRSPSRWSDPFSDKLRDLLAKPPIENADDTLKEYCQILKQNAGGELRLANGSYYYVDSDFPEQEISIDNTASGVMIFLELSRLISNGTIKPGSVLIIDEPETNLHPIKQVSLAKVLVGLSEKLGIKLFLSSHNIYFIRALEVSFEEEKIEDYKFYMMKNDIDSRFYRSVDVTDDTEAIYQELYKPLENL